MGANVYFYGKDKERQDTGAEVFLGVLTYNVEADKLAVIFSTSTPAPEAIAILEKFLKLPGALEIPPL